MVAIENSRVYLTLTSKPIIEAAGEKLPAVEIMLDNSDLANIESLVKEAMARLNNVA